MDFSQYAQLFKDESQEHLAAINAALLRLEASGDPLALQELFRSVHTVKGMSAAMGYERVAELAHEAESLLDALRSGRQPITVAVVETLFAAADALEAGIARAVAGEDAQVDVGEIVARLRASVEGGPPAASASPGEAPSSPTATAAPATPASAAAPAAPPAPEPAMAPAPAPPARRGPGRLVRVVQEADAPLRGVRALLVLQRAEALGPVTDVQPPREELTAERYGDSFQFRLHCDASRETIADAIRAAGDVAEVHVDGAILGKKVRPVTPAASAPAAAAPSGGAGLFGPGESFAASDAPDPLEAIVGGARAPMPAAPAATEAAPAGTGAPAAQPAAPGGGRTLRIDARRLDTLLDLTGELVIARGRLLELAATLRDPALTETVTAIDRHVRDLQQEILTARLVPVWQLFERFPRLVRDAARTVGKEVRFEVEGRDIELDRSLLDEIVDPLVHLLRNAVDHGIESPEERLAAGKPAAGRLVLSAVRDRDTVLVRVSDDGRGIDRAKVLRRAREQGLVDAGTTTLSDDQLLRLVSRAGFSTAERVTSLSGRGVGVDAVQTRVQALGGSVELETREGEGTTVTLRLPMTLAIVRALIARVADETYALPAGHVAATGELAAATLTTVRGEPVVVVGDDVLPAVDLRTLVGRPTADPTRGEYVVLDGGDRRIGMLVDELTGQQEIVVKRYDAPRGALPIFSGATILGNGRPALIVDVGRLL